MKLRSLSAPLAIFVSLGIMSIPSGAASAPNAYAQMKAVFADANAKQTFRYTLTATMTGRHLVNVTDATHLGGRQAITLTEAGKSNTVIVELIAGNAYVKGDAAILVAYMGFPKSEATRLANKWLEFPPSNPNFTVISTGITIASTLDQVTMNKSVKSYPAVKLKGQLVDVLKGPSVPSGGNPSTAETLYFTTAGKPLPVEATETYQGTTATVTFSHWNETVVLATPKTVLEQK